MPLDLTTAYNTPLGLADALAYREWLAGQSAAAGRDLSRDVADYDLAGAFKAGLAPGANGHWVDTFKKPNHPTFSDQSQYHGQDGHQGGTWTQLGGQWVFTPTPTNLANMGGPQGLQRYFDQGDPNVVLDLRAVQAPAAPTSPQLTLWQRALKGLSP